ncbi:MAG: hypothetical protein EOO41_00300 [Methanobacteriota archaeon]|nr:MAG: hypothetical protein EOO41_00300 [Euryarchaeota archaeon]
MWLHTLSRSALARAEPPHFASPTRASAARDRHNEVTVVSSSRSRPVSAQRQSASRLGQRSVSRTAGGAVKSWGTASKTGAWPGHPVSPPPLPPPFTSLAAVERQKEEDASFVNTAHASPSAHAWWKARTLHAGAHLDADDSQQTVASPLAATAAACATPAHNPQHASSAASATTSASAPLVYNRAASSDSRGRGGPIPSGRANMRTPSAAVHSSSATTKSSSSSSSNSVAPLMARVSVVARLRSLLPHELRTLSLARGSTAPPNEAAAARAYAYSEDCRVIAQPASRSIFILPRHWGATHHAATAAAVAHTLHPPQLAGAPPQPAAPILLSELAAIPGTRRFEFEAVLPAHATQAEVYRLAVAASITDALGGRNAVVMCYGQTGSGKTHTMFGPDMDAARLTARDASLLGVLPRAMHDLFERIALRSSTFHFTISVRYAQLYCDNWYDLLPDAGGRMQQDDSSRAATIGGVPIAHPLAATQYTVSSIADVLQCLRAGQDQKVVAETRLNRSSSRSHTIFHVHLRRTLIATDAHPGAPSAPMWAADSSCVEAQLTFFDLAGSERLAAGASTASRTPGVGDAAQASAAMAADVARVHETRHINTSLSALGRVLTALAQTSLRRSMGEMEAEAADSTMPSDLPTPAGFIPWRASKLTHFLRTVMLPCAGQGTNARTTVTVICTLAPAPAYTAECLSTCAFGARTRAMEEASLRRFLPAQRALRDDHAFVPLRDAIHAATDVGAVAELDALVDHQRTQISALSSQYEALAAAHEALIAQFTQVTGGVPPSQAATMLTSPVRTTGPPMRWAAQSADLSTRGTRSHSYSPASHSGAVLRHAMSNLNDSLAASANAFRSARSDSSSGAWQAPHTGDSHHNFMRAAASTTTPHRVPAGGLSFSSSSGTVHDTATHLRGVHSPRLRTSDLVSAALHESNADASWLQASGVLRDSVHRHNHEAVQMSTADL